MSDDKSLIAKIFPALMLFCLLTGLWSFAIIQAWPWDKDTVWKPGVRLPVMCANGEICSKAYVDIAKGVEEKQITALKPSEPNGELNDGEVWLRWSSPSGKAWKMESSMSSWYFETSVRYSLKGSQLEVVQYRHYDATIFFYAMIAAFFTTAGIFLRRLRS
jgi:hypothetical protein